MPPAILLTTAGIACLPLLTYLVFRHWLGRHDLEPLPFTLLCFLSGATVGAAFGLLGARLLGALLLALGATPLTDNLVEAPLAEELAKGLVLFLLYGLGRIEHSAIGLFYGAATGLGFAMTENSLYFTASYLDSGADAWYVDLVVRTLFSTVMHMTASATMGFMLGLCAEHRRPLVRLSLIAYGVFCAFAIHGLWNVTLFIGQEISDRALPLYLFLTVPFIAVVLMGLTELALRSEGRVLREELSDEAQRGLLPPLHADILASHTRRRGTGWLPDGVERDAYVRALCRLALYRHAARHGSQSGPGLNEDRRLLRLREQVRRLGGPQARAAT